MFKLCLRDFLGESDEVSFRDVDGRDTSDVVFRQRSVEGSGTFPGETKVIVCLVVFKDPY